MKLGSGKGLLIAGMGFALLAGATRVLAAASVPSGNMNQTFSGDVVITPNGGTAETTEIKGLGQVIANTAGAFSGAVTYTGVDATLATDDVCAGTVSGQITVPAGAFASGTGNFTISETYTPSSSSTATDCIPWTASLLCNRTLGHPTLVSDLNAGQYHCIATNLTAATGATATINAASLHSELGVSRGANAPNS